MVLLIIRLKILYCVSIGAIKTDYVNLWIPAHVYVTVKSQQHYPKVEVWLVRKGHCISSQLLDTHPSSL